ncbi:MULTISPECIES: ClpXP protease specificity-enhancing factor [Pseudomonas]|jgi:stringent starvation protein B|uniref:ClpXP protease specificity-enhancing factor n=1 Tax=Pseudomonas kulmbachensis TaxID=3043408 RepID=A0ABW7LX49_9PSED|nr:MULTISPECIES: ClpXP protease specificity-enhancing factor [Pseudomonas]UXL39363.1 ClpXP protease specificity-enhancing factor [Pseudomonas fragi]
MNSSRPYLVRALYEWIVDNDCTPHMLVNSDYPKVQVPAGFASDGQIVLNVSPTAVRQLHMDNEAVSFEGRFGGVPHTLYVPIPAILGVYARENGQGMVFDLEEPLGGDDEVEPDDDGPQPEPPRPTGRPSLKVVK